MTQQTQQEQDLALAIVEALELDDVDAAEIAPQAPLFSHDEGGLGLDSIDALEIALVVQERYGVELRADDEQNRKIFASLRSLNQHIDAQRQAAS